MILIIIVLTVVAGTIGYAGYVKMSEWKQEQDKIAYDKKVKAQVRQENARQLDEIEKSKPEESAPKGEKAGYYSEKLDVENRLGNFDKAVESFVALQAVQDEKNMSSYDLLSAAKAYAKQGNSAKAKELLDKAEEAVKRQQSDPVNYMFYMDQVNDMRAELF